MIEKYYIEGGNRGDYNSYAVGGVFDQHHCAEHDASDEWYKTSDIDPILRDARMCAEITIGLKTGNGFFPTKSHVEAAQRILDATEGMEIHDKQEADNE